MFKFINRMISQTERAVFGLIGWTFDRTVDLASRVGYALFKSVWNGIEYATKTRAKENAKRLKKMSNSERKVSVFTAYTANNPIISNGIAYYTVPLEEKKEEKKNAPVPFNEQEGTKKQTFEEMLETLNRNSESMTTKMKETIEEELKRVATEKGMEIKSEMIKVEAQNIIDLQKKREEKRIQKEKHEFMNRFEKAGEMYRVKEDQVIKDEFFNVNEKGEISGKIALNSSSDLEAMKQGIDPRSAAWKVYGKAEKELSPEQLADVKVKEAFMKAEHQTEISQYVYKNLKIVSDAHPKMSAEDLKYLQIKFTEIEQKHLISNKEEAQKQAFVSHVTKFEKGIIGKQSDMMKEMLAELKTTRSYEEMKENEKNKLMENAQLLEIDHMIFKADMNEYKNLAKQFSRQIENAKEEAVFKQKALQWAKENKMDAASFAKEVLGSLPKEQRTTSKTAGVKK